MPPVSKTWLGKEGLHMFWQLTKAKMNEVKATVAKVMYSNCFNKKLPFK